MELLVGRIENCKNSKVLVIHNKPLTNKAKENNQKVTIKKCENGIEIIPGGSTHTTVAAQRRLRITATKLIDQGIIKIKDKNQVEVFIDLNKWNITKKELFNKGMGSPITDEIPQGMIKKSGAIKKGTRTYYIDISSKSLYELSKKDKIKCLFNRKDKDVIIIKSDNKEARRITPHSKKRIQIAIPKEILNKGEIEKLKSKSWFPVNIQFNLQSFNLETKDFFSIKEEKELVDFLEKKGAKIKIKKPSDPYDFLINDKIAIEIHNSIPKHGDLVTRHKVKPALVRLRILEADFLTKNNEVSNFLVIINEEWSKGEYIKELSNKINKKVNVLFTNFKDNWTEKVGEKIMGIIK
ncbi:MAG: hypothetical protein AABX48_02980 [Nanoarchaeota archaeon]